ncbi:hypothetical protein JW911_03865 [Candidatus Peregrinibacteria bacterium]|nr:hypothetical protein [Candidatus Peregrinibacteria bacterium]
MTNSNKPKQPDQPKRPEGKDQGDMSTLSGRGLWGALEWAGKEIKKTTKERLQGVRSKLNTPSMSTRTTDKGALEYQAALNTFEKKLKVFEAQKLKILEGMIPQRELTPQEQADFIKKLETLLANWKTESALITNAIKASITALCGARGAIKPGDLAKFESIAENISVLYMKDKRMPQLIINIQMNRLAKEDWDIICKHLRESSYESKTTTDLDRINLSVSAFLFSLMDPATRYQAVLEYHKREPNTQKTKDFVDALTQCSVLNKVQYEELMKVITKDQNFKMSQDQEKALINKQAEVARVTRKVQEKMSSSGYVNGAQRVLNAKSIGAFLLAGVGAITMITNYFREFGQAKGIAAKLTAGFKNPHFLFGAAVAGTGAHLLGSTMTAGKGAAGTFHKWLYRNKSKENPFGMDKPATIKNNQFDVLASYLTDYRLLNDYLVNKNGFTDMNTFWNKNHYTKQRMETEARIRQKPKAGGIQPRPDFYDKYLEQVRKENMDGYSYLQRLNAVYGKDRMKQIFFTLFVSTRTLGITSSEHFKNHPNAGRPPFTYYQLLRSKQGIERIPAPATPAGSSAGTTPPSAPALSRST